MFQTDCRHVDAAVVYGTKIFMHAGMRGNLNLLAVTIAAVDMKTTLVMVPIFLIDKLGRKPLPYSSTISISRTICLFSVGVSIFDKRRRSWGSTFVAYSSSLW